MPSLLFTNETEMLAVASYGGKLRVAAIAEFAGHDRTLRADRTALLDGYVRRNFGTAGDFETPEFRAGLRPSTPAGPPYPGRVRRYENLWVNAGRGRLGWTLSLGCGEVLSALMTGDATPISDVPASAWWPDAA